MKEYDVIVIGSGSGASILEYAANSKLKTALIDKGPAGGTCLNLGCIPSKMLCSVADRIMEIKESGKFGVESKIEKIDFIKIMKDMEKAVVPHHKEIFKGLKNSKKIDFYEGVGEFVEGYTLKIGNEKIKGKKIFIASGARPLIPKIKGLDEIDYLTNESLLKLKKIPKSLIIVGGGYIAAEYAHFFSALGTRVTILQRNKNLVPNEEPEISQLLKEELRKRMDVFTNEEVLQVSKKGNEILVKSTNKSIQAEKILIAVGRVSNADLLKVENSGIDVDEKGYIKVNKFFETNKKNIWAFGDAIGKQMFTHASRKEAEIVWHNLTSKHKHVFDFNKVPHAIFTRPQIASVGLKEKEIKTKEILIGKAKYNKVAKGEALRDTSSFSKAIIDKKSGKILGFHIIGPYAPILIQEIINVIENDQNLNFITTSMYIHPALPEIIQLTLSNLSKSRKRKNSRKTKKTV